MYADSSFSRFINPNLETFACFARGVGVPGLVIAKRREQRQRMPLRPGDNDRVYKDVTHPQSRNPVFANLYADRVAQSRKRLFQLGQPSASLRVEKSHGFAFIDSEPTSQIGDRRASRS